MARRLGHRKQQPFPDKTTDVTPQLPQRAGTSASGYEAWGAEAVTVLGTEVLIVGNYIGDGSGYILRGRVAR